MTHWLTLSENVARGGGSVTVPRSYGKQVSVQLLTSANDVALPAFDHRRTPLCSAARLLLIAGRAAIDRYLLPAAGHTAANPQQRRAAAE